MSAYIFQKKIAVNFKKKKKTSKKN